MKKVLVTGAHGLLGQSIKSCQNQFLNYHIVFAGRDELNITFKEKIKDFVVENNIDIIINCAAYTNVDGAEIASKKADELNFQAVKNLAEVAKSEGVSLVHISTDYVFDGNSKTPYLEADEVNPQNVYGVTKLKGENILKKINPKNSIVIRTSWLYGEYGHNFVKTMLKLFSERDRIPVVSDQIGTPTYAMDLANTILQIASNINCKNVEVYHFTNSGYCSWYEFAKEILMLTKHKCEIKPVTSINYPTEARRPKFSLLNTEKIQNEFNIEIPYWKDSLYKCVGALVKSEK